MDKLAQYLNIEDAQQRLADAARELGTTEFAQVRNLDYVSAPFELYPLIPKAKLPLERVAAFAVDMDGTSTTTEPLALHSLEYMVRRFTGLLTQTQWAGLDPVKDHPYVIGNSNFRHTEFLVSRYRDRLDHEALKKSFFEAVCWTLSCMSDTQRLRDIAQNARNVGLSDLLADADFITLSTSNTATAENVPELVMPFIAKFGRAFHCDHDAELVSVALDIYYYRYHAIMRKMEAGHGHELSKELLGESGRRLVEPMPGYEVFIPLVKGWLGEEASVLFGPLRDYLLSKPELGYTASQLDTRRDSFVALSKYFQQNPAKVGLVTASIAYETHACMREVINVVAELAADWPVSSQLKDTLAEKLADYRAVFDGFVCATDACEPRLKPHRDLYSLALYQMSIPKADYRYCIGVEDTEPGIIALRAAGIPCAIALPNHDTSRQDYSAATKIVHGGLPEMMLVDNLYLPENSGS